MRKDRESGSTTLEVIILTPIFILLLMFVVFCGRWQGANQDVHSAAGSSARAATLESDHAGARGAAVATARSTLGDNVVSCIVMHVEVDVAPGGGGARLRNGDEVTVTVTCEISLNDVAGLNLGGGKRTATASATEVVDRYRSPR